MTSRGTPSNRPDRPIFWKAAFWIVTLGVVFVLGLNWLTQRTLHRHLDGALGETETRMAAAQAVSEIQLIVLVAIVLGALFISFVLHRVVVRRVTRLADDVLWVERTGDLDVAVAGADGDDEVAQLARAINAMLVRIRVSSEELVSEQRRFEAAAEASKDGIFEWDPATGMLTLSQVARDLLAVSQERAIWPASEFVSHIHPDDIGGVGEAFESTAETIVLDFRYRRPDRIWVWFQLAAVRTPQRSGERPGWIGTLRDITREKQNSLALDQARLAAEASDRAKDELLRQVSHDLRTPLNAVMGFAQLMEMGELPGEAAEYLQHILTASTQLLDLINDLLDTARAEAGRNTTEPEPVHVDELLNEIVTLAQPFATDREVTVRLVSQAGAKVLVEPPQLKRVFNNLLSNAVKYNRRGGMVNISTLVDGREVWVSIVDEGPGISEENLARVFEPFERIDGDRFRIQGTGIGLTITRKLVESMGGTVVLASGVDQGTTATVMLPLYDPDRAPSRRTTELVTTESDTSA